MEEFGPTALLIILTVSNASLRHSKLKLCLVLLALLKLLNGLLLVLNRVFIPHQTRIGQALVVQNLATQAFFVLALGDLVVSQCFFILSKVVIALTSAHVETSVASLTFDWP